MSSKPQPEIEARTELENLDTNFPATHWFFNSFGEDADIILEKWLFTLMKYEVDGETELLKTFISATLGQEVQFGEELTDDEVRRLRHVFESRTGSDME